MKREDLYEVIGNVDEKYVEEANQPMPKKRSTKWIKIAGLAACLCICSGVLLFSGMNGWKQSGSTNMSQGTGKGELQNRTDANRVFSEGASIEPGRNGGKDIQNKITAGLQETKSEGNFLLEEGNPKFETEEYSHIGENRFLSAKTAPFSTFSADVDTASYANLRRMLLAGVEIPEDAIRIEEMLNYFSYDYPDPNEGEPFSVTTEMASCPWNSETKLLLIGLQAKKIEKEKLPASNLVFLIDVSGSMSDPDKLPLVKRAFLLLLENLSPKDRISVVTYASSDAVLLDGVDGSDKAEIMSVIENLEAGGSTQGSKGIETAYQLAKKNFIDGGNNRVILATDGDLNVGVTSEGALTRLIEEKKKSGVFLSVMGFGTGNIKDNKMEALADHGNGNYSYIDGIEEARRVLVQEIGGTLFTVAKDVKLQVEFNPKAVKGYRLIGYENRLMNAEDFADDTKDGGEIGAGHRVTALYEIVPVDSSFQIPEVTSRYTENDTQKAEVTLEQNEWLALNIRYKEPEEDTSKLLTYPVTDSMLWNEMSENMSFAAGVAQFGMVLRKSEYLGTTSLKDVIQRLKALPEASTDGYKDELIYLMGKYNRRS